MLTTSRGSHVYPQTELFFFLRRFSWLLASARVYDVIIAVALAPPAALECEWANVQILPRDCKSNDLIVVDPTHYYCVSKD